MQERNALLTLASMTLTMLAGSFLPASQAPAQSAATSNICGLPAGTTIHALTTDNTIFSLRNGTFTSNRVTGIDGNLIGIDFRVSDGATGKLYGLTDTGKLYRFAVEPFSTQPPQLISSVVPRFAGGFQSLADFNPVLTPTANALRLIGSNDQNFAVVDSGGTLNATAVQTAVKYVVGDANFSVDPNLTAGAYDNNAAGATFTTFYAIDYDLDTFVTIADRNATGSSNTGGGMLKTIGSIVDPSGKPLNFAPNAGLDIFSSPAPGGFVNRAVAVSGRTLYCIDLSSFDPNFPPGSLQKVVATPVPGTALNPLNSSIVPGGFIDVAIAPFVRPVANAGADTFFSYYYVGVVDACQSTGNIASYTYEQVSYVSPIYSNVVSNVMRPVVNGGNVGAQFVQSLSSPYSTNKCAILVEGYDAQDAITIRVTVRDAAGNSSSDDVTLRGSTTFDVNSVILSKINSF